MVTISRGSCLWVISAYTVSASISIYRNVIISLLSVSIVDLVFYSLVVFLLLKKPYVFLTYLGLKLCNCFILFFFCLAWLGLVTVCCYCPAGSPRWDPGLRHQLLKQVERLSLIFASRAHNGKIDRAGNQLSIKEASFSLAQFHVQQLINIYCSHRSQQQQVRNWPD